MAYDIELVERIREVLSGERGVEEKRMFGGLAFLIAGHMTVAASGQGGLLVRVVPQDTDRLLARTHVNPMVMGGRDMRGWLRVEAVFRQAGHRCGQAAGFARRSNGIGFPGATRQRTPGRGPGAGVAGCRPAAAGVRLSRR